ncbi:MAG: hypothetical protein A3H79_01445 [Candidatus Levybacteria bacterium RIFCSPLOWO2_02_FULL_36_8b]|nr:MAG: hypothetical protein A3H79_01445 [Candidatus Levybacteria bacterium RIFCSPLOWO2_02_FULL_36_8b]
MTTEVKVIGGIIFSTFIILTAGVFFLSKDGKAVTEGEVISSNGLHWHPKLSIYIKGEKQEIPANVGIGAIHQPIHTHEDNKEGIIHMEMQGIVAGNQTKLGKFFQIWSKQFSSNCLFDKCNGQGGTVRMAVNNNENKDFDNYLMKDGDNIEIRYD